MDAHIQGYYQEYLSNLCYRRQWPEPHFTLGSGRHGYYCIVRVNNREYESDAGFENKRLAVENAAMRAYAICQNFSKSDGMYPAEKKKRGGKVQGRPIAIGTERQSYYTDDSRSTGSSSGGSSPTSYGGFASYNTSRRSIGSLSSNDSTNHNSAGSSSKHSSLRNGGSSRYSSHRSGRR